MKKITLSQPDKINLLFGLFLGSLIAANYLGTKIIAFPLAYWLSASLNLIFWPLIGLINLVAAALPAYGLVNQAFVGYQFFDTIHVSVGILTIPVMFLITDVITEIKGQAEAKKFVTAALVTMIFVLAVTALAVWLPADPARQYFSPDAYKKIFGVSLRIMMASVTAFILAQRNDIWTFLFLRQKTQGRYLWLRNNVSTIIGQFIDTTIFMFLAFYAISPQYHAGFIFSLIIPYWIFKVLFAVLDTPLCYLLVRWLKNSPDQAISHE